MGEQRPGRREREGVKAVAVRGGILQLDWLVKYSAAGAGCLRVTCIKKLHLLP